jgi:Ca2+-binding RTX toxin-like protein
VGQATVAIVVTPNIEGVATNTASVTTSGIDPNPNNNSASTTTRVGPAGCTIFGTDGPDTLQGTSGNDTLCALNGNDIIFPNGGNDTVFAGDGADEVKASTGDAVIYGGAGDDIINGGPGNDTLLGEEGFDSLDGGTGTDTCDVGPDGGTKLNCELTLRPDVAVRLPVNDWIVFLCGWGGKEPMESQSFHLPVQPHQSGTD